jgi:hypothetical protein
MEAAHDARNGLHDVGLDDGGMGLIGLLLLVSWCSGSGLVKYLVSHRQ